MECLQENMVVSPLLLGVTHRWWIYGCTNIIYFGIFFFFFSFGIKLNYFEEIHTQTHLQSWISTRILFNASPKKNSHLSSHQFVGHPHNNLSVGFSYLLLSLIFVFPILPSPVRCLVKCEYTPDTVCLSVCGSVLVCMCLCMFQCLIMGQERPQAHGGLGGLTPLRFQSWAFLAGCYIAVKTAKQLQQQTLEALGERQLTCG